MIVVSDSSALIGLAKVDQLPLLRYLYGTVLIPAEVFQDVVIRGAGKPGAVEVGAAAWIETRAATNRMLVDALTQLIDPGEAEAIVLATEIDADLLLIDEAIGRREARRLGLHVTGLAGVLVDAKDQGLLPAIKPILDALSRAGFRLSPRVVAAALAAAEE